MEVRLCVLKSLVAGSVHGASIACFRECVVLRSLVVGSVHGASIACCRECVVLRSLVAGFGLTGLIPARNLFLRESAFSADSLVVFVQSPCAINICVPNTGRHNATSAEVPLTMDSAALAAAVASNSKHWFTTSFLQPLPYLVTP